MMGSESVSRREFLRAGAVAGVTAGALPAFGADPEGAGGEESAKKGEKLVPTRRLGKHQVEVSILSQGTVRQPGARHLNVMHEEGIRYIDVAASYSGGGSERVVGEWMKESGRRKEYFLVTKDSPRSPEEFVEMLDRRCEALKTDYIDLMFIHNLGHNDSESWITDKAWSKAADKMRESGKARLVGFSTHVGPIELRTELLNSAAQGSWVDAIMVATSLPLMRDNKEFNKSLDACHKAGVGLISMKECKNVGSVEEFVPEFKAKGLSPYTAVLTAIWSDERFASICSAMYNIKVLKENAAAARVFKPMKEDEVAAVDAMLRRGNPMYCPGCDGSCQRAAGTRADLNTIARYVSYVEEDGRLAEARELFRALPAEARDWVGADLAGASEACRCRVDFGKVLEKAQRYFA